MNCLTSAATAISRTGLICVYDGHLITGTPVLEGKCVGLCCDVCMGGVTVPGALLVIRVSIGWILKLRPQEFFTGSQIQCRSSTTDNSRVVHDVKCLHLQY